MKLTSLTYFGSRQFFKGLIELGKRIDPAYVYCRNLVSSRINMEMTIGGVVENIPDGSTLLSAVAKAAIAGKFTEEEAETIASQLDRIMLVFGSMRCAYYVNAWDSIPAEEIVQEIVEPVLTTSDEVAKIVVAEESVVEAPAKKGRKSSK